MRVTVAPKTWMDKAYKLIAAFLKEKGAKGKSPKGKK